MATKTELAIQAREKRSREAQKSRRREQREAGVEARREAAEMKKAAKES